MHGFETGDFVKLNASGRAVHVDLMRSWEGVVEGFEYFPREDGPSTWVRISWREGVSFLERPEHLVKI